MITTLLIANRGEIACRIIRTCRRLGIRSVAVYSSADKHAFHVDQADEAIWIGGAAPLDSYLNQAALIKAARRTQAQAIHPGYGFLAENAVFARACAAADLLFVGPSAPAIELMGNKRAAKQTVAAAGVPIVPGSSLELGLDDQQLVEEARRIGFPLMIKAAAGGGGLGMRLVQNVAELEAALGPARRDAQAAFGSAELLLERGLIRPRHIEVQVFGDQHGTVVHLGERECSIQRRHQKIIEEAPAPGLSAETREALHTAAIKAAQSINYANAGTVEFLLGADGEWFFLEMNTRLQVEHPVTELITGLDLVEWQIVVAEGAPLPLSQEQIQFSGHAIEARVYAEDAQADFRPATGPVSVWQAPDHVRVDTGIRSGDQISVFYDPMVAKISAWAAERQGAARKLAYALEQTTLLGCTTNLDFLARLVRQQPFLEAKLSTAYLAEYGAELHRSPSTSEIAEGLLVATLIRWSQAQAGADYWRNNAFQAEQFGFNIHDTQKLVELQPPGHDQPLYRVTTQLDETNFEWEIKAYTLNDYTIQISSNERQWSARWANIGESWWIDLGATTVVVQERSRLPLPRRTADEGGSLRAPLPGVVLNVLVEVGQPVAAGSPLLTLEAMKMEHTIRTHAAGTVSALFCAAGDHVDADMVLIAIEETA